MSKLAARQCNSSALCFPLVCGYKTGVLVAAGTVLYACQPRNKAGKVAASKALGATQCVVLLQQQIHSRGPSGKAWALAAPCWCGAGGTTTGLLTIGYSQGVGWDDAVQAGSIRHARGTWRSWARQQEAAQNEEMRSFDDAANTACAWVVRWFISETVRQTINSSGSCLQVTSGVVVRATWGAHQFCSR
jgi:hypothetical protein